MSYANHRFFEHFNMPTSNIEIRMKINNMRNLKDIDYFCFVEGASDESFYNSTSLNFFNQNKIAYLYIGYKSEGYKGKRSVILATKTVKEYYKKLFKKFIFIVDHDIFGIEDYKTGVEKEYLDMLTVLPVYSYENYYFYKDNLENVVFQNLTATQIEEFRKDFIQFHEDITEYLTLKAVQTATYSLPEYSKFKTLKKYKLKSKDKDIFVFNNNNRSYFNKELLEYEVDELKKKVSKEKKLQNLYIEIKKRLLDSTDFIKGKILFKYMVKYLEVNYGIYLSKRDIIQEINRLLEIDIDIKIQN